MVRNWVSEIKEITCETEDVIEIYVLTVASRRRRNILKRYACILNECIARHKVGSGIKDIETKISNFTRSLETNYGLRAISTEGEAASSSSSLERLLRLRRSYSHVVEDDFVGLEEDVEELVKILVNEEDKDREKYYPVVSICGMGGLGKTTLARKIYNHQNVKRHFDDFVWVCISQQWQSKDVLQRILLKLCPNEEKEEVRKMGEDELVRKIYDVQLNKKCLVVVDDIWSMDAWDCLKNAFPIGKNGSKILLTTRNKEVASRVDTKVFLHTPRFLKEEESLELLLKKALAKKEGTDSKDDKIELGRKMVRHCGGLPLAVVVLGGLLATKTTLKEWEMVHLNINSYIRRGEGIGQEHGGGVSWVLALSYNDLPYQLKPCFLYLGSFIEDSEIQVEQLYQLWMAEGMVWPHDRAEKETMMDVAERYLGELARRCMVQVQLDQEEESTGMFTSCRLHDMMRELSLSKGKEENFLEVLDFQSHMDQDHPSSSSSSSISKAWRVAIHLDDYVDGYVPSKQERSGHLRSLLFFTPPELRSLEVPQMMKSYFKDFKFLRVLNLEGFDFLPVPKQIHFRKQLTQSDRKLNPLEVLESSRFFFHGIAIIYGKLGILTNP